MITKIFYQKKYARFFDALVAATVATLMLITGFFDDIDEKASDRFYQAESKSSPDILIVGIDSDTLEQLGTFSTWIRRDTAKAINYLNNNDPESRPAVIGIDVIFSGDSINDPAGDELLVSAASQYDNVVVASAADMFTNVNRHENENPYEKEWPWDSPFNALASSVDTGHVNGIDDTDGIVRHDLLFVHLEERGRLYSFSRVIYQKWCRYKSIEPNPPPQTKENGIFYLPFSAKKYEYVSFKDLIEEKVSPEMYKDKMVIIGMYSPSMLDDFVVALKHVHMYGIEIYANSIQAFQNGFFPQEVEKSIQFSIIFIVCFFTELFFREENIKRVIVLWLSICLAWLIICKICYLNGFILDTMWLPIAVSILLVWTAQTNSYIKSKAEEARKACRTLDQNHSGL